MDGTSIDPLARTDVSFTLNGKAVTARASGAERLSHTLRERLCARDVKVGCNAGDCGACTVLIDGEAVCACMVPLGRMGGKVVETATALDLKGDQNARRLREAFLHYGAAQCGICTPGMLVSAVALLRDVPEPSESQVEDALGGVLCRCTGYRKIVRAIMEAHHFDTPAPAAEANGAVGTGVRRVDGLPKVSGHEVFGDDAAPADSLLLRVVRSPHPHARFHFGDIDAWVTANPGVVLVQTAEDIPGQNRFGVIPPFADQPVFAEGVARFRGEAVATVIGEAEVVRMLDLEAFPVTFEPFLSVGTPAAAKSAGAALVHPDRPENVLIRGLVQRGDLARGFDEAAATVEGRFETAFVEHAYIEPEAGFARHAGNRIEVHACTQAPVMDRDDLALIMGLEKNAVRVVPLTAGGGFGSKLDLSIQPYLALAAYALNRPVRATYTRAESMMSTTKRHPSEITARIAADASGKITAMEFEGVFNTGAYASWGPTVANRVPVHASGPYAIPHYRARSEAVHTHCPPSGAFRGFGVPQSAVAQECLFDELALALDMDPLRFRLKNVLTNGFPTVTGQVFEKGVGIKECFEALQPSWQRALEEARALNATANGSALRRGVGIAGCWYGCGNTALPNPSTIKAGITPEGRVVLHQGAADIGQGANTVVAQIFADALGVPLDMVSLLGGDTDITPDCGKTSASRQTYVTGNAALLSATALREMILRMGNVSGEARIVLGDGEISLIDGSERRRIDLDALSADEDGYVFQAVETYDPPTKPLDENGQGIPYAVFGYGAQMIELDVDVRLGRVHLKKLTAAHDVGRAINPVLIEGQVEGGVAQGIGMALMENYVPGRTENLHDYLIPTFGDMPEVETIIIEVADAHGPFGAKGLGEHVLIPTAPAILNAIRFATGARVRTLPATPDAVLAAIRNAGTP